MATERGRGEDVGSKKLGVRCKKLEIGSMKLEVRSKKLDV